MCYLVYILIDQARGCVDEGIDKRRKHPTPRNQSFEDSGRCRFQSGPFAIADGVVTVCAPMLSPQLSQNRGLASAYSRRIQTSATPASPAFKRGGFNHRCGWTTSNSQLRESE